MTSWHRGLLAAAAAAIIIVHPVIALAYGDKSSTYTAVTTSGPITLDGKISDSQWQPGIVATDFYNLTTRRPASSDTATTAYILYDTTNLYVGFVCKQSSAPVTANQTTNGVGEELDDQVEINIDTSGNGARVYSFKSTPRGVRFQESSESSRFNPPWQAAASIAQGVWTVEMAIPLRTLRSGTRAWRINFQRRIAAKQEEFSWVYDPQMPGPDDSRYWPTLAVLNLSGATTRPFPHADVFGLASTGSDRNQFQQTDGSFAFQKARLFGVDVNYPFTNTLALVATGNPDFSNVEVDQQTIAPQQFQRELTEYRPFFAQGADYLSPGAHFNVSGTKDEVFYSPSVGTFNWGGKIEGTTQASAIGVLSIAGPGFADQAFGVDQRSPSQDLQYYADGVLAHHTQDGSSVTSCPGVLLTCRDDTYEFGVRKQSNASGWLVNLLYAGESGDFVADPGLGHNFRVVIGRERQYSNVYVSYNNIGPYYSPVDGFTLISDLRGPEFYSEFKGAGKPGAAIKNWSGFFGADRDLDRSGQVRFAQFTGGLKLNFQNLVTLDLGPTISEQRTSNGFPSYTDSQTLPYNQTHVKLGYAQESASPASVDYSWGPFATQCSVPPAQTTPNPLFCSPFPNLFANFYLQQLTASMARQLGPRFNVSAEFDGTVERPFIGPSDGQWLRRISLAENLSANATVSVGLRSISGTGGFAEPGLNFATSFHDRFPTGDELFVAFGSPAASVTLNRLIVKYTVHIGRGGVGT